MQKIDPMTIIKSAVFIITFILLSIGLDPFQAGDISPADKPAPSFGTFYFFVIIFTIICFFITSDEDKAVYYTLYTRPLILLILWLFISSLIGEDKYGSTRLAILFCVCFLLFTFVFILPNNRNHFANMLTFIVLFILLLCYLGIIFMPNNSIHQATDVSESHLAGDWRGLWAHKNFTGPIMASFLFISFFLLMIKKYTMGILICILSVIFIAFSGAKTATVSTIISIISVIPAMYISNLFIRNIFLISPVILLNMLGVGQVIFPPLKSALSFLPIDHSFTGRDDIWAFARDNLSANWVTGRGFGYFWGSQIVVDANNAGNNPGAFAQHGHQSYMDMTMNIGFGGLIIFLIWGAYMPMKNINIALTKGHDRATVFLLAILWQYWLLTSTMETILLERLMTGWFIFCLAVCGLHFMSKHDINKGIA
jgi:O-antigen ligase